eukprot:7627784-Alexandrium_andersonii.AAC.1
MRPRILPADSRTRLGPGGPAEVGGSATPTGGTATAGGRAAAGGMTRAGVTRIGTTTGGVPTCLLYTSPSPRD